MTRQSHSATPGHPYLDDDLDLRRSRHRRWSDALVDQAEPLWTEVARSLRVPDLVVGDALTETAVRESIDHVAELCGVASPLERAVSSLKARTLHSVLSVIHGSLASEGSGSFDVVADYLDSISQDLTAHRSLRDDLDARATRALPVLVVLLQVAEHLAAPSQAPPGCEERATAAERAGWGSQRPQSH